MTNNLSFMSQFRLGGDPCSYRESTELQTEIGKLTHPARPDVDWYRVEMLSLALFRQNGVELQTLSCYALAKTKRQGLAGMAEGLGALEALISRHWSDFWPVQVHSRVSLLTWLTDKMQQALRTLEIEYQDLSLVYRCGQHLIAIETILRKCELWHLTKLDVLAGQLRNTALRLERLALKGAEVIVMRNTASAPETIVMDPTLPEKEVRGSEKADESAQVVLSEDATVEAGEKKITPREVAKIPHWGRTWLGFITGMLTMACLGGGGLWGWSHLNKPEPDALTTQVKFSVMPLPQALPDSVLASQDRHSKASLSEEQTVGAAQIQLKQLNDLGPLWALWQGHRLLRQLETLWPDNQRVKVMSADWQKQRELYALPVAALQNYAQAQVQLQRLSQQLDALDERKGRYLTGSELKSAVFSIRQSLQTPPLEELLRQLDEQIQASKVSPALRMQIDTHFNQLLNRYAILLKDDMGERLDHGKPDAQNDSDKESK